MTLFHWPIRWWFWPLQSITDLNSEIILNSQLWIILRKLLAIHFINLQGICCGHKSSITESGSVIFMSHNDIWWISNVQFWTVVHYRIYFIRMIRVQPRFWCHYFVLRCPKTKSIGLELRSIHIYIIIAIRSISGIHGPPRPSTIHRMQVNLYDCIGTWIPGLDCSCKNPSACKNSCFVGRSSLNAPQPAADRFNICHVTGPPYCPGSLHPLQRPRALKHPERPLWLFVMTIPFSNPDRVDDSKGTSSK